MAVIASQFGTGETDPHATSWRTPQNPGPVRSREASWGDAVGRGWQKRSRRQRFQRGAGSEWRRLWLCKLSSRSSEARPRAPGVGGPQPLGAPWGRGLPATSGLGGLGGPGLCSTVRVSASTLTGPGPPSFYTLCPLSVRLRPNFFSL